MNKKDIAKIRKELKVDNIMLKVKEIYNVYVKRETGDIIHSECQYFDMLESDQQELFMKNFKKVLSGELDSKLFELKFKRGVENSLQSILYSGLSANVEEWKEKMNQVVSKFLQEFTYQTDVVFTFIRAQYRQPIKDQKDTEEEINDDEVFVFDFILGSVNKIDTPKKVIMFDYTEKELKSNSSVDGVINLNSPIEGFMFPVFNDNRADVNRILYSAGKADALVPFMVEEVLDCIYTPTAKEEREKFEQILKMVIGEKVDSEVIASIYNEIHQIVEKHEGSEIPVLDAKDIQHILRVSGVETTDEVQKAFKEVVENEHYEFKATNLTPNFSSKSLKITTKIATIALSPKDLKNVRQVIDHKGKKCLLIELDEDVKVEGFTLQPERL
jgi:hypothetical protein